MTTGRARRTGRPSDFRGKESGKSRSLLLMRPLRAASGTRRCIPACGMKRAFPSQEILRSRETDKRTARKMPRSRAADRRPERTESGCFFILKAVISRPRSGSTGRRREAIRAAIFLQIVFYVIPIYQQGQMFTQSHRYGICCIGSAFCQYCWYRFLLPTFQ